MTSLSEQGNYGVEVLFFPKKYREGSTQSIPEVALQKGDFRCNLRDDKQKRRPARGDTNRTGRGGHGYRRHEDLTSPEDIENDDYYVG